jgi:hypothetical protein
LALGHFDRGGVVGAIGLPFPLPIAPFPYIV